MATFSARTARCGLVRGLRALYRRHVPDDVEQAQQRATRMVLLKAIEEYASGVGPEQLLELAQAYAWIVSPEKTGDSSHPLT